MRCSKHSENRSTNKKFLCKTFLNGKLEVGEAQGHYFPAKISRLDLAS